jgi:Putative phage tail protein
MTGILGVGSEAKKKNIVASLRYQTSQKGAAIPLIYGCNRVAGNLLDYQNFNSNGSKSGKGGKGGGGSKAGGKAGANATNYQVDFLMGLCQGPVFNLGLVWFNKTITTLFGGLTAGTIATMGYGGGNDGQPTDFNWYPPNQLGYSGTTWFSVEKYQLGESPALPNFNVEVYGILYGTAPNGCDANPSSIIIDLLTNPRYGAEFPAANLDAGGSLVDYENYCNAVGLMLAPVYDSQQPASQMLAEIAAVTNSAIVWSGGLLKVIPYGDQPRFATYTPASFTGTLGLGDEISLTFSGSFPGSPVTVSHYLSANDIVSYEAAGASMAMLITGDGTVDEPGNGTLAAAGIFASVTIEGLVIICTGAVPSISAATSGSETLVIGSTSSPYSWTPNTTPIYSLGDDDFIIQESSVGTYLGVTPGGPALRTGGGPITGGFTDDPVHIARSTPADALNMVQLEVTDRGTSYNTSVVEAFDQGAIDLYGVRRDTSVKARAIVDPYYVATTVAQLVLQRQLLYRNTYTFQLGWKYILLEPMDLIQITDDRLGAQALTVRITSIEEDDEGTLTVTCEDWFGTPGAVLYPPPAALPEFGGIGSLGDGAGTATPYPKQGGASTASTPNYGVEAPAVNPPFIFEPTAQLLAAQGETSPYIVIGLSGGPNGTYNANWGGANIFTSLDGDTFARAGQQVGAAVMGYTTADCPATGTSLAIDLSESNGSLTSVSAQLAANGVSLCAVRTPAGLLEFLSYTTAAPTGMATPPATSGPYSLTGLYRGLYGTTAIDLPAGSQFMALGTGFFFYEVLPTQAVGKAIYFEFQSFNLVGGGLAAFPMAIYEYTPQGSSVVPGTFPIAVRSEALEPLEVATGTTRNDSAIPIEQKTNAVLVDVKTPLESLETARTDLRQPAEATGHIRNDSTDPIETR